MILVGTVLVIGVSFMSYVVILSNSQRVEAYIRSLVADKALNTVMYLERVVDYGDEVSLYVGMVNILNESTTYYITTFKTDYYGLQAKVYRSLTTSVSYFNGSKFTNLSPTPVDSGKVYIVSLSGDYVPLSIGTVNIYGYTYRHTGLINVTLSKSLLSTDDYVVIMLLVGVGDEYYELLQLSVKVV
jgi:hypothetical protein